MLELQPLISSKIRRALLEHFLNHPGQRFYLRGLAKELQLSISPVRRELLHLEQLGILKTCQEANIRFYAVDPTSSLVAQLASHHPAGEPAAPAPVEPAAAEAAAVPPAQVMVPLPPAASSTVLSHAHVEKIRRALTPSPWPIMAAAVTLTLVMLCLGVGSYLEMTNHRWMAVTRDALRTPRAQVTIVAPPAVATGASASGEMHSARWRVVPGGMGTFVSGSSGESY